MAGGTTVTATIIICILTPLALLLGYGLGLIAERDRRRLAPLTREYRAEQDAAFRRHAAMRRGSAGVTPTRWSR
jgi:hypothetical protein